MGGDLPLISMIINMVKINVSTVIIKSIKFIIRGDDKYNNYAPLKKWGYIALGMSSVRRTEFRIYNFKTRA
jgi:hypothetical protein